MDLFLAGLSLALSHIKQTIDTDRLYIFQNKQNLFGAKLKMYSGPVLSGGFLGRYTMCRAKAPITAGVVEYVQ